MIQYNNNRKKNNMKATVLTIEETEKLKHIELGLLKVFISTCNMLNLRYFVIGGTLLGAVRHKGFIPWDDDIDVAMPRKDYEVWINNAQKLIDRKKYFVQTFETDPEYPNNFAKLRNSNTTFIESSLRHLNINHGAYIDVFPLDYYPQRTNMFRLKQFCLTSKIIQAYDTDTISYPKFKTIIRKLASLLVFGTPFDAVKKREKLYKSVNHGKLLANHCGAWGIKEVVPAEWYGEGKTLKFEGINVNVPQKYHSWLHRVYGDYMKLPPEEKRVTHHYTEVIDLDRPYTDYMRG